jgi:phage gpG-like protein
MGTNFGIDTRVKFSFGAIEFNVTGLDEAIMYVDDLVRRSANLSAPFQRFQKYWFDDIDDNFAAGGGVVEWPALSPAYAADKAIRYPGQPIMRASDRLYESLTSQTGDTVWQVTPRTIVFGSKVPYFEYHQTGTNKMPARPVLVLSDQAARKLMSMVEEYTMTGRTR